MILAFIVTLSVAFFGFYYFYYEPQKRIHKFSNDARKLGYKVLELPYKFMGISVLKYIEQDERSLQVYKEELNKYDLILGNMFIDLHIITVSTNILKDLFNQSSKIHKNPFFGEIFQLLNGGGIAFTEDQVWKRKRRIISSVFHFDFLNQMIPIIEEETKNEFDSLDQKIKNDENIKILPSISKILSTVVIRCFFGTDVNQYKIEGKSFCEYYIQFLNEITLFAESFQHFFFGLKVYNLGLSQKSRKIKRKLKLMQQIARQITENELQKIKSNKETNKNILTELYVNNMLSSNNEQNHPDKYTIDELIGEFFVFFAAGTDTTSNVINLALHYLSEKQEYVQKIDEQIASLTNLRLRKPEQLKKMKWLQAVFSQTLRINGPAAQLIPRIAAQNIEAGGLLIPKMTSIAIYPLLGHHREENFKNHFEFYPQRWFQNQTISPYTYIPFGAGQRTCIGQYLAKIQAKIILSQIIKKYNFKAKREIKMRSEWLYTTQFSDFEMKFRGKVQECLT